MKPISFGSLLSLYRAFQSAIRGRALLLLFLGLFASSVTLTLTLWPPISQPKPVAARLNGTPANNETASSPSSMTTSNLPNSSAVAPSGDRRRRQKLVKEIDRILAHRLFRKGFWGVDVQSVEDGNVFYSRNSFKYFIPASNVKLFTTAAALNRLGPDFRFRTRLNYEGQLSERGILKGNLILVGGGDPNLASSQLLQGPGFAHLDRMVRRVREAGVRVIEGHVIGDDSLFPYAPYGRGWNLSDLEHQYAPAVSALSFHDNLMAVVARPGSRTGQPISLISHPPNSLFKFVNLGMTIGVGAPQEAYLSRAVGDYRATVSGDLPINGSGWSRYLTIKDPALYTATIFRDRLRRSGIHVKGIARSRHFGDATPTQGVHEIYVHESAPLIETIFQINKDSHNLYAEILLRTLGAQIKGKGTDGQGLQVIYEFLQEAGVPARLADLHDGSGLSRYNLITPRAQSLLLKHLTKLPYFHFFLSSLPVSAKDGTLRGRMHQTAAARRIHAKTGTLEGAIALGGYVKSQSGPLLAFSILVNDHRFGRGVARGCIDRICNVLAKY